jgi:outer membrane protein assembly factor BamB
MNNRRRVRVLMALVAAVVCLPMAPAARSEPGGLGHLLWEVTVDVGNFDQAFAVAALDDRVFVAGFVGNFEDRDFFIQAYDARNGTRLWQDQVDNGFNDLASGVVAAQKRVFVSGATGSSRPDWLIRAYDAETGRLLWEDRFDRAGGRDLPRPRAIAVWKGLLFVAGSADSLSVWVVRAYDASTGALVWQDQFDSPGFTGAESLAVNQGRVFVGGFSDTDVSSDALVRTYDAVTGTLLWQHRTAGQFGGFSTIRGLDSDSTRVFAAGSVTNASGKQDFLVQAYDAETGALFWHDQVDKGGEGDAGEGIATEGSRVFARGVGGRHCLNAPAPPSDCAGLIRSYDRKTGTLLWEQEIDVTGTDDLPQAVLAREGIVFLALAVGVSGPGGGGSGDWLVQAYDNSTGQLLWEDVLDTGGGPPGGGFETPMDLALLEERLFVAGRTVDASGNWNFVVRAYNAGD